MLTNINPPNLSFYGNKKEHIHLMERGKTLCIDKSFLGRYM